MAGPEGVNRLAVFCRDPDGCRGPARNITCEKNRSRPIPSNGFLSVDISQSTMPYEYTSTFSLYGRDSATCVFCKTNKKNRNERSRSGGNQGVLIGHAELHIIVQTRAAAVNEQGGIM